MHEQARAYIAAHAGGCEGPILEIGSRDINGTVRQLFDGDYFGIDLIDGPGVDEVTDVTDLSTRRKFATVVCCEVLEHSPYPDKVIDAAHKLLRKDGVLLLTAAGPGRTPHSGIDGGAMRSTEHYANIGPDDLADWLSAFTEVEIDVLGTDIRARAVK